jgi:hypothetical protein
MALIDMKSNLANISKDKTDLTSQKEANAKSNHSKLSPDDGQLITRKIGKKYRGTKLDGGLSRGGAALQVERSVEDTKRIGKFLFSGKGALFTLKQSVLQNQNEDRNTNVYNPLSILTNLDPRGNKQRHIQEIQPEKDSAQYESFVRNGKHGPDSLRRDYKNVSSAVNLTDKNKRGNINVKYGGKFGKIAYAETPEKTLPTDFIKFRIRDAVNGRWINFPALVTGITDNSQASYSPINYIGRPEAVYVYQNRTRSISFNLKVVAFNEDDIDINWVKINYLKGLTQPEYKPFFNEGDTETGEETRPVAPYIYLTIGDMFVNTPGFFESVNVSIPENSSWEIVDGKQFPHMCDISLSFTYIGKELPTMRGINYDGIKPLPKSNGGDTGEGDTGVEAKEPEKSRRQVRQERRQARRQRRQDRRAARRA